MTTFTNLPTQQEKKNRSTINTRSTKGEHLEKQMDFQEGKKPLF
jgi:hypothetical protein